MMKSAAVKREAVDSVALRPPKRSRRAEPLRDEDEEDLIFDEVHGDSDYEDDQSTADGSNQPTNTPLTPISPARRFPSDLKTIRCTWPDCEKTFNRPARLAAHLRSHTNDRPFKCTFPDCDKAYMEEKHLRQHIKGSHTHDKQHHCTEEGCGKSFLTATRLRRHQAVHEGQERYRCRDYPPCTQTFRKHQTLQRHIRADHLNIAAFPCSKKDPETGATCEAGFDTAGALKRHVDREHGEAKFYCDTCGMVKDLDGRDTRVGFTTMLQLKTHLRKAHVNCMFCDISCSSRYELEKHIDTRHSGKTVDERKTVLCTWPGCTKRFTKKFNLNVHYRTVHEGQRFVCGEVDHTGVPDLADWPVSEGCGHGFVTKANLEDHIRYVHLGHERPKQTTSGPKAIENASSNILDNLAGTLGDSRHTIACTVPGCTFKFAQSHDIQEHMQNHHSRLEETVDNHEANAPLLEPQDFVGDPLLTGLEQQFGQSYGAGLQDVADWEEGYGGSEFWIGAPSRPDTPFARNDEWERDHAEMRHLIAGDELNSLIDPALEDKL